MAKTRPRVFPGWWAVLTSAFALFLGPVPIVVLSFGVFLKPLAQEFHSGRAAVSFAFTLHNVITAFALPVTGRLVDRFGARKVILPATIMIGLILLSGYLCSGRIWQLYLFYLTLGLVECGAGPLPYCDVVSHWFDRYRGLALGLMMLGLGFGALIMPSVAQHLIARFGWRLTFSIVGVATLLITAPVVGTFLKEKPEPAVLLPDDVSCAVTATAGRHADPGVSWYQAWHTRTFWFLLCAFVLVSASIHACFTHMAPIFADRGSPAPAAALASSLLGGGLLVGRTGSGYLLDRFFAPRVAALIFGGAAAGIGLLRIASSQELAFASAFLIGLGLGAEVDVMAYLTSRYFGLRSFGEIYGFLFAGFVLAGGLGAYLMGAAFDAKGSYALPLASFCIVAFLGSALMLSLGPYRYGLRLPVGSGPELPMLVSEA